MKTGRIAYKKDGVVIERQHSTASQEIKELSTTDEGLIILLELYKLDLIPHLDSFNHVVNMACNKYRAKLQKQATVEVGEKDTNTSIVEENQMAKRMKGLKKTLDKI